MEMVRECLRWEGVDKDAHLAHALQKQTGNMRYNEVDISRSENSTLKRCDLSQHRFCDERKTFLTNLRKADFSGICPTSRFSAKWIAED